MLYFSDLSLMIFYLKYNRSDVFNQSEIVNDNTTNFQNQMYCKF